MDFVLAFLFMFFVLSTLIGVIVVPTYYFGPLGLVFSVVTLISLFFALDTIN